MTSHDVREVLNLPEHGASSRPSKKQKTAVARPNLKGLAREVQNLGGDNPIAIVPDVSFFKKRRLASRKPAAKWVLQPFMNSAREDDGALILRHWKRKSEEGPLPEQAQDGETQTAEDGAGNVVKPETLDDSAFAKFNVQIPVPQYNEDQYHSNLQNDDWSKDETDYLLELVTMFDLRWALIWDRYEYALPQTQDADGPDGASTAIVAAAKPRTMEDLKARYYEVAAKMMAVQKPAQYMTRPEFELYETMQNFNAGQEKHRKEFALNTMGRSKDEAREEESLLMEVRRILARTERLNDDRRELYNRLDYPISKDDISQFKTSQGLQQLLQTLMNVDKSKKRKSLMGPAGSDGVSPGAPVPGSAASETNRRESIAASAVGHRDSIAGTPATPADATPTANKKKGAQQPERRKLTEHEEQVYGVSHHDRLSSGPTFRYEKINKLYSHKSGQQQMRITNVLSELDVPARLIMPTAKVTAQFEVLWSSVTALVDLRKVGDKLDAEIKVLEQKEAERTEKGKSTGKVAPGGEGDKSNGETAAAGDDDNAEKEAEKKELANASATTKAEAPTEDGAGSSGEAAPGKDTTDSAPPPAEATSTDSSSAPDTLIPPAVGIKEEDGAEKEKPARPGSSGAHKRSASVLSTTSDKSAKRQRK